jgi:UDP-N-acetylmuramyl pentapeptide phosphotransferase/UDP-N-acetylglucosamine-1-phosphate transferase
MSGGMATGWVLAVLAFATAGGGTWIGIRLLLPWLKRRAILDRPNERSSHKVPTPRGAGLAMMAVLLPVLAVSLSVQRANPLDLALWLGAAAMLAAVSWLDDRRGLGALPRIAAQLIAVGLVLIPTGFSGLANSFGPPPWLVLPLIALAWVWFVNLYNFMDGIDGITGVETACLAFGILALAWPQTDAAAAAIMGAALGFLAWNWPPARIFLGDVGSVPLGFLLGALLLSLAGDGHWASALILPLYYLADATLTLLRRAARREKIWRAHREHFYQRATQGGLSHARVSLAVLGCNLVLIGLAVLAKDPARAWPCLAGAALIVAATLAYFGTRRVRH